MGKRILLVHNDPQFADRVTAALSGAGFEVECLDDPMAAIDVLNSDSPPEVLITRLRFPTGKPTGIALGRMALVKCPGIKLIITGRAPYAEFADGVGEFLPHPVSIARLLETVRRLAGPAPEAPENGRSLLARMIRPGG